MFGRKQFAVLGAEFLGTGVLALVMLYTQNSPIGLPYFVALTVGLALAGLMVVFSGNGGNHFNPAVTFGLWTVRQVRTLRALAFIVAQMLGAAAAYYLFNYFYEFANKASVQPMTTAYDWHIVAAEAVGALVLTLAFAAAVFRGYSNAKSAAVVGSAMAMAMLVASAVYPATVHMNGAVNPALALSMRAFDVTNPATWAMYGLGPILGAVIGFNLYALLFAEESSFVRVRAAVAQRQAARAQTATAKAAPAAEAPAKAKTVAAKPAAKRTTRARSTARKTASSRRARK